MARAGLATLAQEPSRYGLSLAIGGAEVSPLELAGAYATLARRGHYRPVSLTRNRAEDFDKSISMPAGATEPTTVHRLLRQKELGAQSCLDALYSLADLERTGRVYPPAVALAPAWKTGTSSGHRDAWCAAVTPWRTVVVWLGNADGSGADALVGQSAAAPLALEILTLVDPSPASGGFAPPATFKSATHQPVRSDPLTNDADSVVVLSPLNGQTVVRDSSLATDRQQIPLRGRSNKGSASLWWFVDGQCIGQSASGQPLWWTPQPGRHEVRATDQSGHSAIVSFVVE
jgi:membrane carboxypeptidase/penicillin-binding protein PbpC